MANDWMVGVLQPNGVLADFDRELTWEGPVPWTYKGYNAQLNGLAAFDHWRAIARTPRGDTYVGSRDFGLWRMDIQDRSSAHYTRLSRLPADSWRHGCSGQHRRGRRAPSLLPHTEAPQLALVS